MEKIYIYAFKLVAECMYFQPGPEVLWGGVQKFHVKNRKETKISLEINGTFYILS